MFTKKDREIANLTAKVINRNNRITELLAEKRQLQDRTTNLLSVISEVKKLSTENTYDRPDIILAKIRELLSDANLTK